MITRKRYGIDFQKKMAVELSTGQSSLSEVSKKREDFCPNTFEVEG
ncbi:MAG: hypothetical protein IPL26_26325 [Leptospiraceae bacterium]|nr:hypothetical protein [Leptospiraceae bacterium]MBK8398750.1 hypothetical protein [Leptospiraceae bacterium]